MAALSAGSMPAGREEANRISPPFWSAPAWMDRDCCMVASTTRSLSNKPTETVQKRWDKEIPVSENFQSYFVALRSISRRCCVERGDWCLFTVKRDPISESSSALLGDDHRFGALLAAQVCCTLHVCVVRLQASQSAKLPASGSQNPIACFRSRCRRNGCEDVAAHQAEGHWLQGQVERD